MKTTRIALDVNKDSLRQRIADNLSAEIKRNRWSGRKMAAALGLSQPYIARRASGETELSASDIIVFAEFLQIAPEVLLAAKPRNYPSERGLVTDLAERRHKDYEGDVSRNKDYEGDVLKFTKPKEQKQELARVIDIRSAKIKAI